MLPCLRHSETQAEGVALISGERWHLAVPFLASAQLWPCLSATQQGSDEWPAGGGTQNLEAVLCLSAAAVPPPGPLLGLCAHHHAPRCWPAGCLLLPFCFSNRWAGL